MAWFLVLLSCATLYAALALQLHGYFPPLGPLDEVERQPLPWGAAVAGPGAPSAADLDRLASLGAARIRLRLPWAALEPSPGTWDEHGWSRVRGWVTGCRERGLEPTITLAGDDPAWFRAAGGWRVGANLEHFDRLAARAFDELGTEVRTWVTHQDPAATVWLADLPGGPVASLPARARLLANLLHAHARAFEVIRTAPDSEGVQVGLWVSAVHAEPARRWDLGAWTVCVLVDWGWNRVIRRACRGGRVRLVVPWLLQMDEAIPGLERAMDFLGVELRAHLVVPSALAWRETLDGVRRCSDSGGSPLQIAALRRALVDASALGRPLLAAHRGPPDAERSDPPAGFAAAVAHAREDGADVRAMEYGSLSPEGDTPAAPPGAPAQP